MILETVIIGKGKYLPGWRWSEHVSNDKKSERHIGYIISGEMMISIDGKEIRVGPGEAFEVKEGHDAWVIGDEPCVALDFEDLGKKN